MKTHLILMLALTGLASPAHAGADSVYARCHAQITGAALAADDSVLAAVKAGTTNPAQACLNLLKGGAIDAGTGNLATGGLQNRKILQNMHRIHHTFFRMTDFPNIAGIAYWWTRMNFFDASAPALYFTKALLQPDFHIKDIFSGRTELSTIRTDMNPARSPRNSEMKGTYGQAPNQGPMTIFTTGKFAPVGDLLGIMTGTNRPLSWEYEGRSGNLNLSANFGGGILGSWAYIMQNAPDFEFTEIDGAEKLPRSYGKSIYSDFLCKDLPAVRIKDAEKYVIAPANQQANTAGFRRNGGCVACHASMDQTTYVLRNVFYREDGRSNGIPYGFRFPGVRAPDLTGETGWVSRPVTNFYRRPPKGKLFFRNYKGILVDAPFTNLNTLGTLIASQDDFYICVAKKYFDHFTGYNAYINEMFGASLSVEEKQAREAVIAMGLDLKKHGDVKKLLLQVFESPFYQRGN
jgi:hypothetical protein